MPRDPPEQEPCPGDVTNKAVTVAERARGTEVRAPLITLTTDFGWTDGYAAAMKGVMLGLAPGATILDVTHAVPPQDVRHGAFVLAQVWSFFPPNTVHVGVVDPGVGTSRRLLAARFADRVFVGPDNGLITMVDRRWPRDVIRVLENPTWRVEPVSATFHGRDIIAPAAAKLAQGAVLEEAGPPCADPVLLSLPQVEVLSDGAVRGEVLHVDHFGNLITSLTRDELPSEPAVFEEGTTMLVMVDSEAIGPVRHTYGDAPLGTPVAYIGSAGFLEIAINGDRAADRFGRGPVIRVMLLP